MKLLVCYALACEKITVPFDGEVIYLESGIAKMQASVSAAEAIAAEKPDMVINIGTAGTFRHKVGDVVVCRKFKDRDLVKVNIPEIIDYIDLSDQNLPAFQQLAAMPAGECSTGDTFVTSAEEMDSDVCDMESFCIAYICKKHNIPFVSVKVVSDVVGSNSVKDWQEAIRDAVEKLQAFFYSL
jgi:adenosylhomocysteine nucleosidase